MPITKEELDWAVQHWTTANYLAAASIYLKDNFFLEEPLKPQHIKDHLLGHWGTCPGINFIYTHLSLLSYKKKQDTMLVVGPGHGFAAVLANQFMDGSLQKYYPQLQNTKEGISKLIKSFCWPGGFPSHANPGTPGTIHEGGELGYALGTAFGAAFDNPDVLVAAIIGDGEAETGPTAAAWHSNKFLNPKKDGAVLPILHLNGYKINSPSIYATMTEQELKQLFSGYGYEPLFVGEDHKELATAIEYAHDKIKHIQKAARSGKTSKPIWPIIILRTRKGWTGVKSNGGKQIEGSFRSHQVPLRNVRIDKKELLLLEHWLRSYKPQELFVKNKIPEKTLKFIPKNPIGDNKHAIGGNVRKSLILPSAKKYAVKFKNKGEHLASSAKTLGMYLKSVFELNAKNKNFRMFSPDELASNKLDDVLKATHRSYVWSHEPDAAQSSDGRVMEMLSEHTLQAWMQGYVLTGRHGLFPSYEAFLPIIDSMVSQYLKFIKASQQYPWRKRISALNYLLTSTCWRQDHNGFSHQNPGFINVLLNKEREEKLVRFYFPADANMLLAVSEHALQSTDRVNVIVADKQLIRQWQTYDEAVLQAKTGAGIWQFASDENPDVVLATCGDYQTQEGLATVQLLKELVPEIKLRFVNISELNVIGDPQEYANALHETAFNALFTKDKHVVFTFHGYPDTIKQLLFDRKNTHRFHIFGYTESGSTTTPFDMLVRNGVSRFDLAMQLAQKAAMHNPVVAQKIGKVIEYCERKLQQHKIQIETQGIDMREYNEWSWNTHH